MLEAYVGLPDRLLVPAVTWKGGEVDWGLDEGGEAGDGSELVPDHAPFPRPREHPGLGHGDELRPGPRHRDEGALLTKLRGPWKMKILL